MKSTAIDFIMSTSLPRDEECFYRPLTHHQHQTGCKPAVLSISNLLSPDPGSRYLGGEDNRGDKNHKKMKRKRASPSQLLVLTRVFNQTSFPSTELRAQLGKQLNMSPRTVQIWFQNRRQALRTQARISSSSSRNNDTGRMIKEQQQVPASPPLSPLPSQPRAAAVGNPMATTMTATSVSSRATVVKICLPPLVLPDNNRNTISSTAFPHHHHYQKTPTSLPSPTSMDRALNVSFV